VHSFEQVPYIEKLYMPPGIMTAFLILAFAGKRYGHTEQIES
jgi:hypothetical protein